MSKPLSCHLTSLDGCYEGPDWPAALRSEASLV